MLKLQLDSSLRLKDRLKFPQQVGIEELVLSLIRTGYDINTFRLDHKIHDVPNVLFHDLVINPGVVDHYDIALSLYKKSFLTGFTLISLLGWTEYSPKVIHVNYVRDNRPKYMGDRSINNEALQKVAFKPKRKSNKSFIYESFEIVILSGQAIPEHHLCKASNDLNLPFYARIPIIERLFLELLISYQYFGGCDLVWEILLEKASILDHKKLLIVYEEMNLVYPYANAIGYILERSGIDFDILELWKKKINFDLQFHLFLGDSEHRKWNKEWNLYIPKRFTRS